MGRLACARGCHRVDDEAGFTLVEALVSLVVLATVFTALAYAMVGSLRASMMARVEQQGVDFATQALETIRQGDYYDLAHVASDLTGDPRITTCGTEQCVDPGTGTAETLVTATNGSVTAHVAAVDAALTNDVPFTLSTYVTDPGDATADYKRVTVIASWSVGGVDRERVVSGFVTATDRGLPLPVFKLVPLGGTSIAVNPGAETPFAFELTNQGAPDRWNLTFGGIEADDWSVYRDDGDRVWSSLSDVPLTNTNSAEDSLVDTGRIDPTASVVFWAVRTVDDDEGEGDYVSTLTATSAAQASEGQASVDLLVRVVAEGTPVEEEPGGGSTGDVPGAPENLMLTTGDGQLTATWNPPTSQGSSAITDYLIAVKETTSATWTTYADGVSTDTSVIVTGLTNGTAYDVSVWAVNDSGSGLQAVAQGMPEAGSPYVAPTTCAASSPAPSGSANNGYTLRRYALHNRSAANPDWPGIGSIAPTSTVGQGLPLVAAVDGPQLPGGTSLPIYSSDISETETGRVVRAGGSFASTDTTRIVDWRSAVGNKAYKGTAVLGFWLAPTATVDEALPLSVTAQPYIRKSNGSLQAEGPAVTASYPADTFGEEVDECEGWLEVWMTFSVNQPSTLDDQDFIGVRLWNSGGAGDMDTFRIAYDVVDDFPSYLTVPEKP